MTATSSYSPTGDAYVDGVLSGVKWGVNALTYSFPTQASQYGSSYSSGEQNNNFEAFTAVQQAAVRAALQNFSAVANLTFTEVTETASQHGELRYAESDAVGTAWAYYPSTSAAGATSDTSWTSDSTRSPVFALTLARMRRPSTSPGPRYERTDERLALSYDDL